MAEKVTEPALPKNAPVTEPAVRDPRRSVWVYDTNTKAKLPYPVPETHLDIFPHLAQVPSDKIEGE